MKRQTVAVIDDGVSEPELLEGLAASLDEQVDVCAFDHPTRAVEHMERSAPDLVVARLHPPEGEASDFVRRLRLLPACAAVPIMVVVAAGERDLAHRAIDAGASDFLLSPVDAREFRTRARNLLMLRRQQLLLDERREVELALLAAKEEAELASRSKTEFLANMSHELRTPLNAIIGFSQVMAEEVLGPIGNTRYAGYARDIGASAQHLLGIISDILDVSKLEAGKIELDEADVEIAQLVRDVLHLVAERASALDVAIDTDHAPDLPRLRADPLKLKQVLLNLLTNAVKFSHGGGRVLIRAEAGEDGMRIIVIDHGIGMDAAEIATAVTRFGQVASTWSRKHPGTGLGLPLAIGLVELHGGRLEIDSEKGMGTTVTIRLPAYRVLPAA